MRSLVEMNRQSMALNRTAAEQGYYEIAYHALGAALHCAQERGDEMDLHTIEQLAREQMQAYQDVRRDGQVNPSIFANLAMQARGVRLRLESDRNLRNLKKTAGLNAITPEEKLGAYMNNDFRRQMELALYEMWQARQLTFSSKDVHTYLTDRRVMVPPGAMFAIFSDLLKRQLINGEATLARKEAVDEHGAWLIYNVMYQWGDAPI